MAHCFTCNNEGFEDKECPSCRRQPRSLNLGKMEPEMVSEFIVKAKNVKIPEEYVGVDWSATMFWRYHQDKINDMSLKKYVAQLQKVHDIFVGGTLPGKGAIIIAPSTYSKVTFAYSCMQHALKNGFSVAELLDTLELQRLMVLAGENPLYKLHGYIDYDEYMLSDVMFITVTKTKYKQSSFSLIQEIFDRRSRKGLSTFVISQADLNTMASWDRSGNLNRFVNVEVTANPKKFPAIIAYKEGLTA